MVTDANGTYTTNVPAGSTLVDIEQSDVDSRLTHTVGDDPTTLTVLADQTVSDIDGFAPASINGVIFIDNIDNDAYDPEETGLVGWIIEFENAAGEIVIAMTAADGTFGERLAPGDYTVRIKSPGGLIVKEQQVTLTPGIPVFVPEPIDPSGVLYNETTGDAVPGATITILNAGTGTALPAACLGAGEQGQVTGATGAYAFFLNPGVDPVCPAGDTVYAIKITPSAGFQTSIDNPAVTGALDAGTCPRDAVPSSVTCEVSDQVVAPIAGIPPYYMMIELAAGDPAVFNNHIPLRLAPVVPYVPQQIPTLSEWALMMLIMLLGFVGYRQGLIRNI